MAMSSMQVSTQGSMKVLIVSGIVSGFGFVVNEALGLSKRGVRIHIARELMSIRSKKRNLTVQGACVHNFSRKIDPSIIPVSMRSITELPFSAFFHPKSLATMVTYSWFVTKLVKKHNVDLINAHFAVPEGFAGLIAKRETHRPLIVTLHGYDVLTEPSINYGARLIPFLDNIVRKVLKEADLVITESTATANEALRIGCKLEKLALIPNGVDTKRFDPKIDGGPIRDLLAINDRSMVFTLRRHVPKNGIEYLIKAASLVLKDKQNVVLVIGSDGPLRWKYERLVADLGITENVIFTGFIHPKDVPYYYAASDIFVVPSVIEAFGLVTVEAMACGKPVIGANVGGIPDVIKNGLNGYLVEPKDPKSLADKIAFLIENPGLMKKMGREGRRIAEKNFDIEKRIDKILTIYSDLTD